MSGTMLRIDPNAPERTVRWEKSGPPNWETLRDLVGGYIERVRVKYQGRTRDAWVDEDGRMKSLSWNAKGTQLLCGPYVGTTIVGPMVVWIPDKREQVRHE